MTIPPVEGGSSDGSTTGCGAAVFTAGRGVGASGGSGAGSAVGRGAGPVSTPATASGCERSWIGRGPRAIPWKLSTSNADATVTGRGAVSWLGPTKGTANATANGPMQPPTRVSGTTGRARCQDRFHVWPIAG